MATLSEFDINSLLDNYKLTDFVESGTLYGDSVAKSLEVGFERAWSVEIEEQLFNQCSSRFHNDPRVFLFHGSSHKLFDPLCQLLSAAKRNSLFWLDAHFPGADAGLKSYSDTKDPSERMPILQELKSIFRYNNGKSVIMVDDVRCFAEINDIEYHDFDGHMKSLGQRGDQCTRETVVGISLDQIMKLIPNTYNIQLVKKSEGSLLITPKDFAKEEIF